MLQERAGCSGLPGDLTWGEERRARTAVRERRVTGCIQRDESMGPSGCKQKMWLAMGLGLAFVTLPVAILLVYTIVTGSAAWIGLFIAAVMLGLPSALFTWLGLRERDETVSIDKTLERRVLQLAASNDGELTASDLALGSQLTIEDCQDVLEYFERVGVARGRVDEEGRIRYTFPELMESMEADDDFMDRLEQEDPRSVLDFEASDEEQLEEFEERLAEEPARHPEDR